MLQTTHIPKETADKIRQAGDLLEVIRDFHPELKHKGSSYVGECKLCGGKKFTVTPGNKQVYKCFKGCEDGGKYPVQYLTTHEKMSQVEALLYIADRYGITIDAPKKISKRQAKTNRALSFRDQKLKLSGLSAKDQKYTIKHNDKEHPDNDRFQAGSIDKFWNINPLGDDMILHYIGLDGRPMTYKNKGGKLSNLIRVRYKNPELEENQTKDGKIRKYASPYKSGSNSWIPEYVRRQFDLGAQVEILATIEGELKAEKACKHKLTTLGCMGIHNFSYNTMPVSYQILVKKFHPKYAPFILDADWRDIKYNPDKSIDSRPQLFAKAVIKYRNFFQAINSQGDENVKILFGSHKNTKHKGLDDLLVHAKKKADDIVADLKKCITIAPHDTEHFQFYDITSMSDYQIKDIFYVNSSQQFIGQYEAELKELKRFRIGSIKYVYNEENDEIELADSLAPSERFWIEKTDKDGKYKGVAYEPIKAMRFLHNRGIGNYFAQDGTQWLIHIVDNIVTKVDHIHVQRYVLEFAMNLHTEYYNWEHVAAMIFTGSSQYLGAAKCSLLQDAAPNLYLPKPDEELLAFKNGYVRVSKEEIKVEANTDYHFWKEDVIDFDYKELDKPIFTLEREGDHWAFDVSEDGEKSDIVNYIMNTSNTFWNKQYELQKDPKGNPIYVKLLPEEYKNEVTAEDVDDTTHHIASKILAIGYLCHRHVEKSLTKAVIGMDLKDSAQGESEGGTGKSILGKIVGEVVNDFTIPGQGDNIAKDTFLFDGVDERTNLVIFDDASRYFNFNFLFPYITGPIIVNSKGLSKVSLGMKKYYISLNGVLKASSASYRRRQYVIGFTDFYNEIRSPRSEFGHDLLSPQWPYDQWNYCYNFIAHCIKTFLKYKLDYSVPEAQLLKRRQRDSMGDLFLEWAETKWYDSEDEYTWINKMVYKKVVFDSFIKANQSQRKWTTSKNIKPKAEAFAKYMGLTFNICGKDDDGKDKPGGYIKSGGKEWILISDDNYDAENVKKILIDFDEMDDSDYR